LAKPPKASLDRETADDASPRAEVEGLLGHDRHSQQRIQDAIVEFVEALPGAEVETEDWTGRMVGAYRIVSEIGQSGMGSVFEAIRDDDEFQKESPSKWPLAHRFPRTSTGVSVTSARFLRSWNIPTSRG